MNRSGTGRVQQQATRTTMQGMTRQSTAAAQIGSRAQFRSNDMQRNAPTQRGATTKADDKDEDEKDDEKEPLFSRDNPDDEPAGQSEIDSDEADAADDEADDVKVIVVKS
ncbi:MAG TPA: hypothetical protein VFW64_15680 [Pseudonocardiaceae bacterium]|nr:hypothetical protein [Pseudonocardiaceae bacterium]